VPASLREVPALLQDTFCMFMDANRDEDEIDAYDAPDDLTDLEDDPNAYWRRRFIILAGGIAALGLCVWLFPGDRPTAAHPSASASASMAALAGASLPSRAYGTAWRGPATKKPSAPKPSPSASASHSAAAKTKKAKKKHPGGSSSTAANASGGPRCAPGDIVLSLFASQPSYAQGELPSFSVYAVSTSATACTLSYGPGSVHIVVTRHGRVVWDSAACKPSAAPRVRFTLGVPQVLTMPWNRRAASPPGCGGSLSAGAGGTFDAIAMTVGQTSPVRSFKLDK
jgi:hypothetical protein